jgi:Leucine-rich repeat (LRR) protein
LNLRRNRIEECLDLDHLPALQRLFLSNNALATLDAIGSVIRAPGLTEYDEERSDERA